MPAKDSRTKRRRKRELREGFTTGTAAAAAAKSALHLLLTGSPLDPIPVTLPEDRVLSISLQRSLLEGDVSLCSVIKDAGDDPDVTHAAEVGARVRMCRHIKGRSKIIFKAGKGVGRVTKPGLPLNVGEPAINPVPRQMIQWAIDEVMDYCEAEKAREVEVEVFVTDGENLAKKTLNPRLGVVGGLSILGTTGIVRPLSHEAYKETILAALSVARAAGTGVVLSTGGKSERFARRLMHNLAEESFVQIADFYGFSLQAAAKLGFEKVTHSVFIGKLVKMAMGLHYTHANRGNMDLGVLSGIASETGGPQGVIDRLARANTARHALEIMQETKAADRIIPKLSARAIEISKRLSHGKLDIHLFLFDYNGQVVFKS